VSDKVNLFVGTAPGERDPEDPEVVTVVWATLDGIEILDATAVAGGLLRLRLRVPEEARRRGLVEP
jgi:hypothetical protein